MKTLQLLENVARVKTRGAWDFGVKIYATELLSAAECNADYSDVASLDELKAICLNGADNWAQYSAGGRSLVCNYDIAERLCSPSELKRVKHGEKQPNSRETWIDVQARALFQAWEIIKRVYNEMNKYK